MPAMLMAHEVDPRQELLDRVGTLKDFEVFHNQALCAVYVRPDVKTVGGLLLPDATREEDKHQGKVGLIVKLGPTAFQADPNNAWKWPEDMGLHDWVYYRASDGWAVTVIGSKGDKVLCRVLDDTDIRGRIPHPDTVW
jgi:hypothetical protein